jgi:hypothetical protein
VSQPTPFSSSAGKRRLNSISSPHRRRDRRRASTERGTPADHDPEWVVLDL